MDQKTLQENYDALKAAVSACDSDYERFRDKKVKASGARVRANMLNCKKMCDCIRKQILVEVNAIPVKRRGVVNAEAKAEAEEDAKEDAKEAKAEMKEEIKGARVIAAMLAADPDASNDETDEEEEPPKKPKKSKKMCDCIKKTKKE